MEALPTYTMMYVPIPKVCVKKIQHCQRSFILGDPMEKNHIHSIRWRIITKDNIFGGLDLWNLPIMNKSCLESWGGN